MNELALITWVCSALRAAVSHWWQLCFALAFLNGQQAAEGMCSGSVCADAPGVSFASLEKGWARA